MTRGPLVVKVGGSIASACRGLLEELAALEEDVVLVHGFGPQATEITQRMGLEVREITSPAGITSRFTDEDTMEALCRAGRSVGRHLAAGLWDQQARAVHVPPDHRVFQARAKPALRHVTEDGRVLLVRGNRSGTVTEVDPAPVLAALARSALPVVTPIGHDATGPVSVDADRAAAALAGALEARALLLFTDVPGYLDDPEDPESRVDLLDADAVEALLGEGATGGMVRKLVACREALEAGAPRALIASGLGHAPVARAMAGEATEVIA